MGPERKVVDDVDVLRWSRSKNCIYFEAELNLSFSEDRYHCLEGKLKDPGESKIVLIRKSYPTNEEEEKDVIVIWMWSNTHTETTGFPYTRIFP